VTGQPPSRTPLPDATDGRLTGLATRPATGRTDGPTRDDTAGGDCCPDGCAPRSAEVRSADQGPGWQRARRWAVTLAWVSLAWMTLEGAAGLIAGARAGSVALTGWALGSVVEGLASTIVIWRFSGSRTLSYTAERRAQQGVAVSFWLLAPYITLQSCYDLATRQHATVSRLGIALTVSSIVIMPALGQAKRRLGARLGSSATAGEGNQNLLCAAQAAAVLVGLAANAWIGVFWLDGLIGLGLAAIAVREGRSAWRGEDCC